jgi:uncharacterized BrkB/YihY/UPF0761 family membrane protein
MQKRQKTQRNRRKSDARLAKEMNYFIRFSCAPALLAVATIAGSSHPLIRMETEGDLIQSIKRFLSSVDFLAISLRRSCSLLSVLFRLSWL